MLMIENRWKNCSRAGNFHSVEDECISVSIWGPINGCKNRKGTKADGWSKVKMTGGKFESVGKYAATEITRSTHQIVAKSRPSGQ